MNLLLSLSVLLPCQGTLFLVVAAYLTPNMKQTKCHELGEIPRSPGISSTQILCERTEHSAGCAVPSPGIADKADFPPAGYFGGNLAVEFCLA
jgi:hypothetical protein